MSRVLRGCRSGYYEWPQRPESSYRREDRRLSQVISSTRRESRATYGSRHIKDELAERGEQVSRARISRLMKRRELEVKSRRKFKATTDSQHQLPPAPDLRGRNFLVTGANAVWLSDISYVWTEEGRLYLAGNVNLYSRMVVGRSTGQQVTEELTLKGDTPASATKAGSTTKPNRRKSRDHLSKKLVPFHC